MQGTDGKGGGRGAGGGGGGRRRRWEARVGREEAGRVRDEINYVG